MRRSILRSWRSKRKITQAELASRVGVSRQYYNLVENGHAVPSVRLAKKLASFLDEPVLWYKIYSDVTA